MIQFTVPVNYPLTKVDQGIKIYTVLTVDEESTMGAYPSVERAVEYIYDWLIVDDNAGPITLKKHGDVTTRVFCGDDEIYSIVEMEFRL